MAFLMRRGTPQHCHQLKFLLKESAGCYVKPPKTLMPSPFLRKKNYFKSSCSCIILLNHVYCDNAGSPLLFKAKYMVLHIGADNNTD